MKETDTIRTCPICGGKFEHGHTSDMGRSHLPIWIEGAPEHAKLGGLKTKDKRMYYVVALRCVGCGFIAHIGNTAWKPGDGVPTEATTGEYSHVPRETLS